jgi:hypothetical protein
MRTETASRPADPAFAESAIRKLEREPSSNPKQQNSSKSTPKWLTMFWQENGKN